MTILWKLSIDRETVVRTRQRHVPDGPNKTKIEDYHVEVVVTTCNAEAFDVQPGLADRVCIECYAKDKECGCDSEKVVTCAVETDKMLVDFGVINAYETASDTIKAVSEAIIEALINQKEF